MWALNDTYRRFFPRGARPEHKYGSRQMYRHDDFVVNGIVSVAVHRAAEFRTLALDYPYRSVVSVCQPGKHQYPGHAYSIRNENLPAPGVEGNRARIAKTNRWCSRGSVAQHPLGCHITVRGPREHHCGVIPIIRHP